MLGKTALTDEANMQMLVVEEDDQWDVPTGYALLAGVQLPPVVRGDDLEDM